MTLWKKLAWIGFGVGGWLVAGLLFASLLFFGPAGTKFLFALFTFVPSLQPWQDCDLPHPAGAPEVAFLQKSTHPFLSGYDHIVRFGRGLGAAKRPLPMNPRGETRFNVYHYPREDGFGPVLRVQGHETESLLRLDERRSYLLVRYGSRTFAGEIQDGMDGGGWGTMGGSDGRQTLTHVTVGGRPAGEITETPVGRGPGRYLGRIEDRPLRFIPAEAEPEVEIPMDPYLRDASLHPGDPGAPERASTN